MFCLGILIHVTFMCLFIISMHIFVVHSSCSRGPLLPLSAFVWWAQCESFMSIGVCLVLLYLARFAALANQWLALMLLELFCSWSPPAFLQKNYVFLSYPAYHADCSLRQGAGGTEFVCFGSRTFFLRWFYLAFSNVFRPETWRIRFCPSKNAVWRSKTTIS